MYQRCLRIWRQVVYCLQRASSWVAILLEEGGAQRTTSNIAPRFAPPAGSSHHKRHITVGPVPFVPYEHQLSTSSLCVSVLSFLPLGWCFFTRGGCFLIRCSGTYLTHIHISTVMKIGFVGTTNHWSGMPAKSRASLLKGPQTGIPVWWTMDWKALSGSSPSLSHRYRNLPAHKENHQHTAHHTQAAVVDTRPHTI